MDKTNTYLGAWCMSGNPTIAESLASTEADFVCIDLEHSSIGLSDMENCIRAIHTHSKEALVRLSDHSSTQLKRVLDCGADGVIVPNISTTQELDSIITNAFYFPGKRGLGLYKAQNFGKKLNSYLEKSKEIKIIIQIENIVAFKNLDELLTYKGVFGSIIGPYDLSQSIGKPGEINSKEMKQLLKKYVAISKDCNVKYGIHSVNPDFTELLAYKKQGFSILAYSTDLLMLQSFHDKAFNSIKSE